MIRVTIFLLAIYEDRFVVKYLGLGPACLVVKGRAHGLEGLGLALTGWIWDLGKTPYSL